MNLGRAGTRLPSLPKCRSQLRNVATLRPWLAANCACVCWLYSQAAIQRWRSSRVVRRRRQPPAMSKVVGFTRTLHHDELVSAQTRFVDRIRWSD